jgi:hypothetical protein
MPAYCALGKSLCTWTTADGHTEFRLKVDRKMYTYAHDMGNVVCLSTNVTTERHQSCEDTSYHVSVNYIECFRKVGMHLG